MMVKSNPGSIIYTNNIYRQKALLRNLFFIVFYSCSFLLFSQTKPDYFQQEVNYEIKVKLDDKKHELTANEKIEYTNNSSKSLSFIYFHLWPIAYKKHNTALGKQMLEDGNTALFHAPDSILGYIDQLDFKSNGKKLKWDYIPGNDDICIVSLPEPLLPGKTINITTPFHVKLPKGIFSRLGHMDQAYQITQWYPKPAVFDKNRWHPMSYLDQGEFYSEFGSFDVFITLPKNYVVGATGDLVDGEQELKWLEEKHLASKHFFSVEDPTEFAKMIDVDSFRVSYMDFPPSSSENKTLHYHQENVHDFAWFADKRYNVLKGEVELPHSKKKVTTWAMFTHNESKLWKNSIEYLNDAVYYYSLWNGDYPYKQATAVDGALSAGGGMEYPNVTVIGPSGNDFGLEMVIMHEVGHNWFYGILGSNERDHPWMDEGINTQNNIRYVETKYPNRKLVGNVSNLPFFVQWFDIIHYPDKSQMDLGYLLSARQNLDQAIEEKSASYLPINYGGIVYGKTGLMFDYLMAYLGEELYDKCMQRYYNEWQFKHPQPEDLREVFEKESNKDLSWFF